MRKLTDNELKYLQFLQKGKTSNPKLRVCIYARKSSDDTYNTALDAQINQCKKMVEMNSEILELLDGAVFSEEDVSGMFTDNRTEFQKVMKLVEAKEIDVILVHTLDRFTRKVADLQKYQAILKEKQVALLCTDSPLENNAVGELLQNITMATSQFFVRQTAEKTFHSLENKAKDCRITGGIPNFGYKYEADRYVINPDEAVGIEMMFKGVLDGKTYDTIVEEFDTLGITTRKGKKFSKSAINDILHNVKYCGTYLYNKKGGKRKKHRVLLGEFDEVRIEGGITEAIIDKDTFDKVQEILATRVQVRSCNNETYHPLTGLVYCKDCGSPYVGHSRKNRYGEKEYSYLCKGRTTKPQTCSAKEIKAEYLENFAKNVVVAVVNSYIKYSQFDSEVFNKTIQSQNGIIKRLNREIADVDSKIEEATDKLILTKIEAVKNALEKKIEDLSTLKGKKEKMLNEYQTEQNKFQALLKDIKAKKLLKKEDLFVNNNKALELFRLVIGRIEIDDSSDEITIKLKA